MCCVCLSIHAHSVYVRTENGCLIAYTDKGRAFQHHGQRSFPLQHPHNLKKVKEIQQFFRLKYDEEYVD